MKTKKIKNWKVIKSGLSFAEAAKMFKEQKIEKIPFENVSIRLGRKQYIKDPIYGTSEFDNDSFHQSAFFSTDWEVLVPDTDEEARCEKVRELMKNSCCSGLKNDKIDNLTIDEMYDHISSRLDKDQKYRMLLAYYDKMIYKTK